MGAVFVTSLKVLALAGFLLLTHVTEKKLAKSEAAQISRAILWRGKTSVEICCAKTSVSFVFSLSLIGRELWSFEVSLQ